MNIKQLKYFIKICETRSFSRAAENLYISQQGLSMAILRLEQELSCSLFERTPNGLLLTQDSEYLLPKAIEIVKHTEDCELHFQKLYQKSSSLKLCGTPSSISEYAGDLLFGFQGKNPHHKIKISECSDIMCDTAVETGHAELAFTIGPVDEERFDCKLMLTLPLFLLIRDDHPFAQSESVRLEALKTVPLTIMWGAVKIHSELIKYCEDEGFTPEVQHVAVTPAFAHRAVIGGAVALMLRSGISEAGEFSQIKAIPIEDSRVKWDSYLIKKRGASLSAGAQEFEQFVLQNRPTERR